MKNSERNRKKISSVSENSIFKRVIEEDELTLERIKELTRLLKLKYSLSTRDILHIIEDKEILIPISIFTKQLSILETITKYLKEELSLSFHQIGEFLNRNERNIWHTYKT